MLLFYFDILQIHLLIEVNMYFKFNILNVVFVFDSW